MSLENGRHVKGWQSVHMSHEECSGTCLDNCRNLDKFPTSYAETHSVYYSAFRMDGPEIIKINFELKLHSLGIVWFMLTEAKYKNISVICNNCTDRDSYLP